MESSEVLVGIGSELAEMAAKGMATSIANRVKPIHQSRNLQEVCNSYEELLGEVVHERARAIAIAQAYEAELKRYVITDEDIQHLQNTIGNALDLMKLYAPDTDMTGFEQAKSLVTADALKALQLLICRFTCQETKRSQPKESSGWDRLSMARPAAPSPWACPSRRTTASLTYACWLTHSDAPAGVVRLSRSARGPIGCA